MKLGKVFLSLAFIVLSVQLLSAQTANNSSVKINVKNGQYIVSGVVTDENTKSEIAGKIKNQLGNTIDFSALKINSTAEPFAVDWRKNFDKSLLKLKNWKSGVFIFTANRADSSPNLPDDILNAEIFLIDRKAPVRIADYRNKTIVLFFLEAWCSPCLWQANELKDFYSEISPDDIEIIGVSTDAEQSEQFGELNRRLKFNYKIGRADKKLLEAAMNISKFPGIPQTFVIRDGRLYGVFNGASPVIYSKLTETILEVSKTR
jgi:peroxiredoxin